MTLPKFWDSLPPAMTGPMARQSSASLAVKLFAVGCGFLYAVAAARLLGPTGYGTVAFAMSVATIAATFSLLGTNGLAIRVMATLKLRAAWGRLRGFIEWSCGAVIFVSIILGALVAAASTASGPYRDALLLVSVAVPLLAGLQLLRGISQGAGLVVTAQIPMDVVRLAVTLSLIGVLIVYGSDTSPTEVILVLLLSLAVAFVLAAGILRRYLKSIPREGPVRSNRHQWLSESLPFLGIALFGIVGSEINTLLLGWLAGPREAGLYQPIARLAPIMMLSREAIEMPLAPRMASLWESQSTSQLRRIIQRSALACTLATAGLAGLIVALSAFIFAAFGPEFGQYRHYLYWIAAAQVLNAAVGPSSLLLAMVGNMRLRIQAQVTTLVLQIGLGVTLIPIWGAAGAAISLAGGIIAWSGLHWLLAWRSTGINTSAFALARPAQGTGG